MLGLKKIKASALYFAILVSVVIALLLLSFLVLTHTHRLFGLQSELLMNTVEASQDGIEYALDVENTLVDSLRLENDNLITVIKKEAWGGFLKIESKSISKTKSFSKIGLIGQKTEKQRTAIWSSETQLPLVLVGNSKIEGDAYVSSRGIKAGVISGKYFNGKELIDGNIKVTDGTLPELDEQWILKTKELLFNFNWNNNQIIEIKKENKNSFFEPTKVIYEKGKLVLDQAFIGNIIIKSEEEIIVTRYAKLTDVVLIAPKITVEKEFSGNAHFVASQNIKLEANTQFLYPSSLVVIDGNEDFKTPITKGEEPISITEKVNFKGVITYIPKNFLELHSQTSISIQTDAVLEGNIYCKGNMELLGTVKGTVFTEHFLVNEFGSKYFNHIYNGRILSKSLPNEFSGLPLSQSKKGVAQWLY